MNSDEKPKIRVLMMLEVIGKPPEHLVETLELLIKQLGKEKGVEVKNKNIKTPIAMEKKIQIMNPEEKATSNPPGDFYTTFAEIEIDVNNISVFSAVSVVQQRRVKSFIVFFLINVMRAIAFVVKDKFRQPFKDFIGILRIGNP